VLQDRAWHSAQPTSSSRPQTKIVLSHFEPQKFHINVGTVNPICCVLIQRIQRSQEVGMWHIMGLRVWRSSPPPPLWRSGHSSPAKSGLPGGERPCPATTPPSQTQPSGRARPGPASGGATPPPPPSPWANSVGSLVSMCWLCWFLSTAGYAEFRIFHPHFFCPAGEGLSFPSICRPQEQELKSVCCRD